MNPTDTPTPRTDACPHCGAAKSYGPPPNSYACQTYDHFYSPAGEKIRSSLCREREKSQKLETEVERLRANLRRAIEIAVNLSWDYADTECDDELDHLKATICP